MFFAAAVVLLMIVVGGISVFQILWVCELWVRRVESRSGRRLIFICFDKCNFLLLFFVKKSIPICFLSIEHRIYEQKWNNERNKLFFFFSFAHSLRYEFFFLTFFFSSHTFILQCLMFSADFNNNEL